MGTALFITLEQEIPGFDPFVNGKALSDAEKPLHRLAKQLGVTPLLEFFSTDPEEAAALFDDFFGDDADVAKAMPEMPAEQWYSAADGLTTVTALKDHLQQNPQAIRKSDAVLKDLEEFEEVLARAHAVGVRWHLGVDF